MLLGWMALGACSDPVEGAPPTTDPELLPPEPFGACAVPVGGLTSTEDLYGGIEVALAGPIQSAGTGDPPDACFLDTGLESTRALDRDTSEWIVLADADGAAWRVGFASPRDLEIREGDVVTAVFSYRAGGFSPSVGALEIRDAADALLVWIGVGGDLPDLAPPEGLALARGDEVALDQDDCGSWSSYALDASLGGETQTVAYGGSRTFGEVEVWHGGFDASEGSSGCADWYVAHVAVAMTPAPEPIE